ncbi:MAG: YbaB/EbfC family nucleoid-associated protein [Pseudomonadota bacterium]|jgi:DNA-binding YbaB/EbfC family protein|nr:YbaB/EbfC family nucleoid-associated protein [Pseudomonadota bacterium]
MKNLGQLMKQAQEMQTKMAEMQQRLMDVEISGSAAAGMVTAVLNGKGEMRKVKIDPSLIIPDEAEVLEDLIVAAQNDARAKVDAFMQEETSKMMGGVELPPGFKMPF